MSDPEDSHMLGSSSSSDDEAMFPSEFEPPGSTLHDNLAPIESKPSDLTPPQSQELHDAMDIADASHDMNGADQLMDAAQGIDHSSGNGWGPKSDFAKSAEMVHEPGSCWNNKKAREEWQKAWNQIEDKSFSLKEFGDPFDENEGMQGNGK
ncbi:MAG: hypothetical protein ALECFALPRED_001092 [Alectoria fallacina]|uniref:Uncharacterized protein n=1 Tax=Alectoria fallacina TaxID=1903189 RepID=A0A8H3FAS6_9LECA|nr:MAG: hypothetical protein ALECFALPRED_001092 [Alectoria fallacina]